jgi:hypothetical protein
MTSPSPVLPPESIGRGTVFALIALPVGVVLWLLVWSFGFIASIVAFVVAIAAAYFYRLGSGGRIGKLGGWIVTGVTAVTLLVAWFAGLALSVVQALSEQTGMTWMDSFASPYFSEVYSLVLADPDGELVGDALLTILFGALGAFSVLRSVFKQAKADAATPLAAPPGFGTPAAAEPEAQPEPEADAAK